MKELFEFTYSHLKSLSLDTNILCVEFWLKIEKLKQNFNENKAVELLIENIVWLVNHNVLTADQLLQFESDDFYASYGIYFNGDILCCDSKVIAFGGTVTATGHSKVILFNNANCKAYDTTFVMAFNNATVTTKDCICTVFHNATVRSKGYNRIEAYDTAIVFPKETDLVILRDNAKSFFK